MQVSPQGEILRLVEVVVIVVVAVQIVANVVVVSEVVVVGDVVVVVVATDDRHGEGWLLLKKL